MIALGLVIELIAASGVIVGVVLPESQATSLLVAAIVAVLAGLALVAVGVRRARPPRRGMTAVGLGPWAGSATADSDV